jgi:hypothetical protein
MRTLVWTNTAAIGAGTAYAIPASAGLLPNEMLTGVVSVTIAPLASAGAASTTSPVTETAVAPNTTDPGAGQVSVQLTGANAQHLISGDAIPAEAVIVAVVLTNADAIVQ